MFTVTVFCVSILDPERIEPTSTIYYMLIWCRENRAYKYCLLHAYLVQRE